MEQWSQPAGRAQVPGESAESADPPAPSSQVPESPPAPSPPAPSPGFSPPQPRPPTGAPPAGHTPSQPTVPSAWQPPTGPPLPPSLPGWQPPGASGVTRPGAAGYQAAGVPAPPHGTAPPPYGASPSHGANPPPYGAAPSPYAPPAGAPGRQPSRRRGWPGVLALILVAALTAAVAVQTWQLVGLSARLDEANDRLATLTQDQSYSGERLDLLEGRAAELERLAGEVFDSEAIANAVLPSVFKVSAGDFTGTAFAVGAAAEAGGTNLLTNFHVVEQVWEQGQRQVTLERTNQRYEAEIIEVEPGDDLAWLHTRHSFVGLAASQDEVRSGQPIIAVGAPLGLTDTVTTGVVSSPAQRLPDGSGPWIQFDAAINPGNSGGPVINSSQEVVGIATTKGRETEGLGFAVPIEVACERFDVC